MIIRNSAQKFLFSFLFFFFIYSAEVIYARNNDTIAGELKQDGERVKKGLNFGALPAVAFDSDLGFQYGLLGNLFQYGDGSAYPDYRWSLYGEWSRTTKGSGINQLFFDSKYLLPHQIRITADFSFLTERALDFYGFNGYEAIYNPAFEDDTDTTNYISRVFYRHERKLARVTLDFQGKINQLPLRWLMGYGYFNTRIASVDIERLNKGRDEKDELPDVDGLYDKYVKWGIIPGEEADGGTHHFIKMGLVFDTRDNEANPNRGLWTELVVMTAPRFLGNSETAFTKLALTHRQYFTLKKEVLTFAYRLGWQGTINGETPFYMQPYMINTFTRTTKNDGLGGARSLRGILRNRIVGDAFAYGNFELRYKFLKFYRWKQNFYFSLNAFSDLGLITKEVVVDKDLSVNYPDYFDKEKGGLHSSYGAGLRIAMNQNFILAVDYGLSGDKRDGDNGLYINLGFLF
ncbi:MAG: BamA/TamA family outer membrane protein [Bacteroidales bacterium]|nr:BamA/TamA family outer membrane protein [Bacteroidales bacterium]MBK9357194.1 BamA/TamA family outer membrane protein [Bacteroidales bacterium]